MLFPQQGSQKMIKYGKVYPLRYGFYSNPQMCMFSFTLLLIISMSVVMTIYVFYGFYQKIIGIVGCFYCVYRFISLGLSDPGLAVQFLGQYEQQSYSNSSNHQPTYLHTNHNTANIQLSDQIENKPLSNTGTINNLNGSIFHRFCNECRIPIKRYTRHCKTCRTCIDDFDHHCIWIGKCIGQKNMGQFKDFLCFVFITLIYGLVLSIRMSKVQKIK